MLLPDLRLVQRETELLPGRVRLFLAPLYAGDAANAEPEGGFEPPISSQHSLPDFNTSPAPNLHMFVGSPRPIRPPNLHSRPIAIRLLQYIHRPSQI
jgi:hypothetical protein